MNIALNDAGVTTNDVKLTKLLYVSENREYRVEFSYGLYDYVYVIHSVNGDVLSRMMIENTVTETPADTKITADKALNLALEAAGVEMADLTTCDIKYHNHKEGAEFKIHFHVDKDHYEYTVNAVTGEVTEKTKPVPPHEAAKPAGPKEKEESKVTITFEDEDKDVTLVTPEPTKKPGPVPPHEKAEAAKPAGPKAKEAQVTITMEK